MPDTTTTTTTAPKTYQCDDGNAEVEIDATSSRAAAELYVSGGDWPPADQSAYVRVWVWTVDGDDRESHLITVDPDEPACVHEDGHHWTHQSVVGNGGGVVVLECCDRCAIKRETDTWAQDPSTGDQGLESVRYLRDD